MTTTTDTFVAFPEPIRPDWTIAELLSWLADDDRRCHDLALHAHLADVDAWLGGIRTALRPSPIALVRSIAAAVRADPACASLTVAPIPDARRTQLRRIARSADGSRRNARGSPRSPEYVHSV